MGGLRAPLRGVPVPCRQRSLPKGDRLCVLPARGDLPLHQPGADERYPDDRAPAAAQGARLGPVDLLLARPRGRDQPPNRRRYLGCYWVADKWAAARMDLDALIRALLVVRLRILASAPGDTVGRRPWRGRVLGSAIRTGAC